MKIKKYTIDQEIPKGSKFLFKEGGDIISTTTGGRYLYNEQYFYFLVEEENVPSLLPLVYPMRETNTIKCPKCSHTIIIY